MFAKAYACIAARSGSTKMAGIDPLLMLKLSVLSRQQIVNKWTIVLMEFLVLLANPRALQV